eukprot:5720744-Prymnesium_polylepis.2
MYRCPSAVAANEGAVELKLVQRADIRALLLYPAQILEGYQAAAADPILSSAVSRAVALWMVPVRALDEVGIVLDVHSTGPMAAFSWNARLEYYAELVEAYNSPQAVNTSVVLALGQRLGRRFLLILHQQPPSAAF